MLKPILRSIAVSLILCLLTEFSGAFVISPSYFSVRETHLEFLNEQALSIAAQEFRSLRPSRSFGHRQSALARQTVLGAQKVRVKIIETGHYRFLPVPRIAGGSGKSITPEENIALYSSTMLDSLIKQAVDISFISPNIPGQPNHAQDLAAAINSRIPEGEPKYKTLTVSWIITQLKEMNESKRSGRLTEAQTKGLFYSLLGLCSQGDDLDNERLTDQTIIKIVQTILETDPFIAARGIIFADFPQTVNQYRPFKDYWFRSRKGHPRRRLKSFFVSLNQELSPEDFVALSAAESNPVKRDRLNTDFEIYRNHGDQLRDLGISGNLSVATLLASDASLTLATRTRLSRFRLAKALDNKYGHWRKGPPATSFILKPEETTRLSSRYRYISVIGAPGADDAELAQALATNLGKHSSSPYEILDLNDVEKLSETRLQLVETLMRQDRYRNASGIIFRHFPTTKEELDRFPGVLDALIYLDIHAAPEDARLVRFLEQNPGETEARFYAQDQFSKLHHGDIVSAVNGHGILVTAQGWTPEEIETRPNERLHRQWVSIINQLNKLHYAPDQLLAAAQSHLREGRFELALPRAFAAFELASFAERAYEVIVFALFEDRDGSPYVFFPHYQAANTSLKLLTLAAQEALQGQNLLLAERISRTAIKFGIKGYMLTDILCRALGFQTDNREKVQEALALAQTAAESRPEDLKARQTLARMQVANGQFEQAQQTAMKIPKGDPGYAAALEIRALAAEGLKEYSKAVQLYRELIVLKPNSILFRTRLARALMGAEDWGNAVQEAAYLVSRTPSLQHYVFLIQGRLHLGQISQAKENFRAALKLFSESEILSNFHNPADRASLGPLGQAA